MIHPRSLALFNIVAATIIAVWCAILGPPIKSNHLVCDKKADIFYRKSGNHKCISLILISKAFVPSAEPNITVSTTRKVLP